MGWSLPVSAALTYASWATADSLSVDPPISKQRRSTPSRKSRQTFSFTVSSIDNCDIHSTAPPGRPEPLRPSVRGDSPLDSSDSIVAPEFLLRSEKRSEPAREDHSA